MAAPSLQAQIAAVRIAAAQAISLGKAAGIRSNAQVDLLREQLAAAAATLERLEREARSK